MNEQYLAFIRQMIKTPAFEYSGVRKLLRHTKLSLDEFPELTYEDLGYKQNKRKQMERNYIDKDEFDRVRSILAKRSLHKNTSVALSMRGAKKDSRSQGWCMLEIVITRANKGYEAVDVNYRSTELILKFGADLVFIPWVLDQIGVNPIGAKFHFLNSYLSGVFFPTLCQFWDPIEFFTYLKKNDPRLFACGTRYFLRSAYKKDQSFPYSPEQQQHKLAWERLPMKRIRDYLHGEHSILGKPMPTTHHPVKL